MEDMFMREDGVSSDTIEECLKHALPPRDHGGVLLGLALLDSIITNGLFGRYRRYN